MSDVWNADGQSKITSFAIVTTDAAPSTAAYRGPTMSAAGGMPLAAFSIWDTVVAVAGLQREIVWGDMAKTGGRIAPAAGASLFLMGCAMTSRVMGAGDGTYLISAHASAVRGGATGANMIAYDDAQKFCAEKGDGSHAIVVNAQERDVYQSGGGGAWSPSGGGFGYGSFAAGNVNFRFRCGR